jgi:hypothetical protein
MSVAARRRFTAQASRPHPYGQLNTGLHALASSGAGMGAGSGSGSGSGGKKGTAGLHAGEQALAASRSQLALTSVLPNMTAQAHRQQTHNTECPHVDRPHKAKGRCRVCYRRYRRAILREEKIRDKNIAAAAAAAGAGAAAAGPSGASSPQSQSEDRDDDA